MTPLRIGVVGGSIAGCCAAAQLLGSGHTVEVFERSQRGLVSQDSGLGLHPSTLDALIEHGLVERTLPRLQTQAQVLVGACTEQARFGREALRLPLESWSVSWTDLYHALRRRLDDAVYAAGKTVTGFDLRPDAAEAVFSDGERRIFDVLIFADGHASLARSVLFPEHVPRYRGYVLWRGVVRVDRTQDISPLRANVTRISLRRRAGHAAFYLIPTGTGNSQPDDVLVNFAYYLPVPAAELEEWLVDQQGRKHRASVPRGALASTVDARLRALARETLPAYYAGLVAATSDTMVHAMFSTRVPAYRSGRVCLIGDASTLAPPFAGSGVLKATHQAFALAHELSTGVDVAVALDTWNARQVRFGDKLHALAEHMEQRLIWKTPDFAALDVTAALEWWRTTTALPKS
jgi:2-polyprenyl-6-methoxyphenol hydroxylase-like FAD-dependent oxidoreductase